MMRRISRLLAVGIFSLFAFSAFAQEKTTRILFLLDASGSMYANLNKEVRIDVAKRLLKKALDSLEGLPNVEVALRVYGHQSPIKLHDCKDTKLEVPFSKNNYQDMRDKLDAIKPKGTTLIAYSLEQAANDFPKDPGARNVIILITDGIEECAGDPCAVSEALQRNGVVLKPFVIGLGGNESFLEAFNCIGKYYNATTEENFNSSLNVVILQALNNTTVQVNLIDAYGYASETNVPMSFYDAETGKLEYNFVHTMNDRGLPDTLSIEPTKKYNLVIHTKPQVEVDNIELIMGRHNIIPVDVPQGSLQLIMNTPTGYDGLKCVMRQAGQSYTFNVQDVNTTIKYLIGKYDIEILTLPRIVMKDLPVDQNKITKIEIPQPGKLALICKYDIDGAIFQMNNGKLEWVCDLDPNLRSKVIPLQPSLDKPYRVMYRFKHQTRASYTFEKEFIIKSGFTTSLNLY